MHPKPRLYFFLTAMLLTNLGFIESMRGQESTVKKEDTPCVQKDLPDVFREWRHKPPTNLKIKTNSLLLVPVLGSNPALGFMIGVAGQYAFRGKDPKSLYSSVVGNLTFTTKKQILFQVKNNIYTKEERLFLSGDWRFFIFSQSTYGLGTNSPQGGVLDYQYGVNGIEVSDDSLVQPMKFNHIRFYQTASWKIKKSLYLGFGYHLDHFFNIIDERLDTANNFLTSHYLYSTTYGFDPEKYTRSGVSLNFVMDTRDNLVNSYKGVFINVNYRLDPKFLGSSRSGNLLSLEWRSFHSLSKKNPRHSVAFWMLGTFSPAGDMPYLGLPALGYDQRSRSGRGYTQGRFRGPNMLYGESEYRFPISSCGGVLGGVLFVNATTTDKPDKSERMFNYVQAGYGFGLRLMVDKQSRTNLQVDFAFGKKSSGVYFGAAETF